MYTTCGKVSAVEDRGTEERGRTYKGTIDQEDDQVSVIQLEPSLLSNRFINPPLPFL